MEFTVSSTRRSLRIVFAVIGLLSPVATLAETQSAFPKTRDPWLWPFDQRSIWNMPIGSQAKYVPANLKPAYCVGVDTERHIRLKATDPERTVRAPLAWDKRWPGGEELMTMPVPDSLVIPDAAPPSTPNACTSFLLPDGKTVIAFAPTCRVVPGTQLVGNPAKPQDLYGLGYRGAHWGSGLSVLGGSIRLGELVGPQPIRHAIKINLPAQKYCYYSSLVPGHRWPATKADSYAAEKYKGKDPRLVLGALLAIRPELTPEKLRLTSVPAKKLFFALQNYGAYVTDDSGWDAYDLCVELGVPEEVEKAHRVKMVGTSGTFFDEFNRIVQALHIVDNNAPGQVGGGGEPRQPLAPRLTR